MFKRDPNGRWVFDAEQAGIDDRGNHYQKPGYRFCSGKIRTEGIFDETRYQNILEHQKREPMVVMKLLDSKKRWWMFMDEIYYEDEGFSADEVKVLILDMIEKRKKKVQRAQARLKINPDSNPNLREMIPDDVKAFVWQRDGGKCVRCGSQEKLEFDHIIPFSKGGSSTARNIQLLCEKCNREKSANLF